MCASVRRSIISSFWNNKGMMRIFCLMLCLAGVVLHGESTILNSVFSRELSRFERDFREQGGGRFRGVLPRGWKENYAVARDTRMDVESRRMEDANGAWLRFQAEKKGISPTVARFMCNLPPLKRKRCYRIFAVARSSVPGGMRFYFREQGSPYRAFGMVKLRGTGDWEEVVSEVRSFDPGLNLNRSALFFELTKSGVFDLRSIAVMELPDDYGKRILKETVFTEELQPFKVDRRPEKLGLFDGVLPGGWQEDFTHWCPGTAIRTQPQNEQNRFYLRFSVEKAVPDANFPGFRTVLPPLTRGTTYELSALAANRMSEEARLSIRRMDRPYRVVAALRIPRGEWKTHRTKFTFHGDVDGRLGLFLNFEGTGTFDLSALKLAETSPGDDRLKRPSSNSLNILANSCFPLGIGSGWNLDQWRANGTIIADPAQPGPSGGPSLKLSYGKLDHYKGRALAIYSAPFITASPGRGNTCSFSYRGEGKYSAQLRSQSGRILANAALPPTKGAWRRAALSFTSSPDDDSIALHLISEQGDLWFDALRVVEGSAQEYRMQMANEVALAVAPGAASSARIQFSEEKALLDYWISGEAAPAELHLTLFDLYGGRLPQKSVRFDGRNRQGRVELQLPPKRSLGQFRIEAVLMRAGKPVSPVSELILTRIDRPRYFDKEAPADSPFGIHVNPYDLGLTAVKAAGCTWVRTHDAGMPYIGWAYLEKEPGKWSFYDAELMMYRKYGFRILGEFGTCPPWASNYSRNKVNDPERKLHYAPYDRKAFANYVRTVASRYKGVIDEWTFWNEPSLAAGWRVNRIVHPDGSSSFDKGKDPAGEYAEFSRIAFRNLRAVNPAGKLIAHYVDDLDNWSEKVYRTGAYEFCDGVEFHTYLNRKTGFPGDGVREELQRKLAPLPRPLKPVYLSEGQGASRGNDVGDLSRRYAGLYRHTLPWKNDEEYLESADKTVRFTIALLACGVDKVFLYSAHCFIALVHRPNYMALVGADGYPHPMLAAYSAMTCRLEGLRFVTSIQPLPGAAIHIFSDGQRSVAAVTGDTRPVRLNCRLAGAVWADLFGNPVANPADYRGTTLYLSAPVAAQTLADSLTAVRPAAQAK